MNERGYTLVFQKNVMRCVQFLCVVIVSLGFQSNIYAIEGVDNILDNTDAQSGVESAPAPLPEVGALRMDWWRFFEVDALLFNSRIKEIDAQFNELIPHLTSDKKPDADKQVKHIIANLQALAKLREQKVPASLASPIFKPTYSVDAWLGLESRYRERQRELTDEQTVIEQLVQAVDAATKIYDREMNTYNSTPLTAPNRALMGLHVVARRTALELARLRLVSLRKQATHIETAVKFLLQEKKVAVERLTVTDDDFSTLTILRAEQQDRLMASEKVLDKALSRVLGAVVDTQESNSENRLQEQQVVLAEVNQLIESVQLAAIDSKIALARLLGAGATLTTATVSSSELDQQLKTWQQMVKESTVKVSDWRATSQRELGRVQSYLLNQSLAGEKLDGIYQKRNKLVQETFLKLHESEEHLRKLEDLRKIVEKRRAIEQGVFKHSVNRMFETIANTKNTTVTLLTESLFTIGDTPVTLLGLMRVIMILAIAWGISTVFRGMLARFARRSDDEGSALYTVGRLAHYAILLVGMIIALSSIGLDFTNLALVAGALSVGIGFGLQSIVNNFVSGLILLFERSLKAGDFIELDSGVLGVVMEINVRSTLINTNDNVDIIVPNAELVSAKVTNWTLRDATRRMRIPFGVAYGTDKDLVKTAVLEAAERVPETLRKIKKHEPQIWLVGFGDSSLDFELVVWVSQAAVKRPGSVTAAYLWEIENSLRQYNIEIPFPQRDLHIRSSFESQITKPLV